MLVLSLLPETSSRNVLNVCFGSDAKTVGVSSGISVLNKIFCTS